MCNTCTSCFQGEFLSVTDPTIEAPFSPSSLPPFSKSGKMVSLWVTDYMANTAALVYKRDGYLNYNITPNMVLLIVLQAALTLAIFVKT